VSTRYTTIGCLTLCLFVLAGCSIGTATDSPPVIATLASFDTLPTARFLTQNAPPPGFGTVQVDPIDRYLTDHSGWAYTVTGSFDGHFDNSGDSVRGRLRARVQSNELGQTRRVVLEVEGRAFLPDEALLALEGVRWSNDYYVVDVNGACSVDQGGSIGGGLSLGDLSAGQILGGVRDASPTGHRATLQGLDVWEYTFAPEQMRLPAIFRTPASAVDVDTELWIAPAINAVLRYDVTAAVSGVHLLWADRATASPVSGTLELRYELDVPLLDVPPNIAIPHGC
jgi:hypothetical protein